MTVPEILLLIYVCGFPVFWIVFGIHNERLPWHKRSPGVGLPFLALFWPLIAVLRLLLGVF